ncbi:MAG TPA: hypothetical protein VK756_01645 [Solirubrobacteraceae bacterium]|nr:hypothetical protein [Solirubrobacteraceae bacterium]
MNRPPPRGETPRRGSRELYEATQIELPHAHLQVLLRHARRKLEGRWVSGETREHQAFGLLAGRMTGTAIRTSGVFPLLRNLRGDPRAGADLDAAVRALATPSRTPLRRRGWLADSREIFAVYRRCEVVGDLVYGSYHMHKVSWKHDPLRDTPTPLDNALGVNQGIWMLIVSMVDPHQPRLRAFFEGDKDREVPIAITE